ncbi:RagB/SusD family nutrient uptake outer membrane protein [Maribacter sp. 2-571]|uniref:RagB/SusD family nutrient uptake outer membrane protein n=1 Tax=Maribacter sp. 2-571 TaxID=3417569 RepID=UPI003D3478AF
MKKRYFIPLFASLFITSCDVLEPEPQTSLDTDQALIDGASAQGVLSGTYSLLQDEDYYGLEYTLNPDLLADNSVFEGFFDSQLEMDQNAVPITNGWIRSCWPDIYVVISSANLLITGVDAIEDENLDKTAILAEAHAIRALAYFDLLRIFGEFYDESSQFGLPLFLEPIPNNDFNQIPDLTRSTVAQTYDQILADLDTAIQLSDGNADPERMNFFASLSLRARVNLYRKNYAAAFADADRVITEGGYILEEDLNDVYDTTDPSGESIFEVVFGNQDQSSYNSFTIRRDEYNVDATLLEFFEEGDARSALFTVARGRDRTAKYPDNTNANNAKVFRLPELYLIRSEAAVFANNDPDAGTADLNILRTRAGLADLGTFADTEAYLDALLYERRAELNFEGHRFFDLIRTDRSATVLGLEDFRRILPIPRAELQVSENLEQNPGYPRE